MELLNWTAKRSGAHITIEGDNDKGEAIKISQVESISIDEKGPYATTADGKTHRLAADDLPF